MSFLRPEAVAVILRWREAAVGLGAAALGVWWMLGDDRLMVWVGLAFLLGGLAVAREGLRRARRPVRTGGPGVVEVDERRITYFSADGGGAVSIETLARVHIEARRDGPYRSEVFWVFTPQDGPALHIPGDADGADALFDALAPLPGADHAAAIRAAGGAGTGSVTVWEIPGAGNARRLH